MIPVALALAGVPPPVAQLPPLGGANAPPLPVVGAPPALGPATRPRLGGLPLPPAHPPARLLRGISDGNALVTAGQPRPAAIPLRRGVRAGAQVARLPLLWNRVERGSPLDAEDPGDPAYDFTAFDALLRETRQAGLVPLVRVSGAPAAHEAAGRWDFAAPGT